MILYYTSALKGGQIQQNPNLSLGGYISNSIIPNGVLNNLFSDIGVTELKNNLPQTRIIALQNITGQDISSFSIYFSSSSATPYCDIKLGMSTPYYDSVNQVSYFETLQNQFALPYYTSFADYTLASPFIYNNIFSNGAYLGIYLQRTLITANNPDIPTGMLDNTTLYNNYLAQQAGTYTAPLSGDDISLVINW